MARNTFTPKDVSTEFIVRNIAPSRKNIRIFGLSLGWGRSYDLLTIPDISESDIRHSLLKGELKNKAVAREIRVTSSTIDLYQYDPEQRIFLESIGVDLTVWDDLLTPLSAVILGGGITDPTFATFLGGVRAYSFSDQAQAVNEQEVFFSAQLPHSYKEGTDIFSHVHWSPSTTAAGTVRWGLEYTWQIYGDGANVVFASPTIIYAELSTNSTAHEHLLAEFPAIDGAGKTISSILICRLFRNSSHANDTYNGDSAFALEHDFHFEKNTDGSRTLLTK